MQKLFSILIVWFLFVFLWGCQKQNARFIYDNSYKDQIEKTRKEIAGYFSRKYIPGGNIAVAKENKIIYSEGIGLASKELKVPLTRNNKLRIGSVSQIFTTVIYLKLVEEGILEPDSTIQYYLPDYPATKHRIAIKHLPCHVSGIRQETTVENKGSGINTTIKKGFENFMNDPVDIPPGFQEEQSMYNTNILGAIMEKVTGKKFPQLLKDYVSDTLHLNNTVVDDPFTIIEDRSDFYDFNMMGQIINAPFQDMRFKAPFEGILSNAEDLVKLGMAILESEYFTDDFREKLFQPCDLYGGIKTKSANGWVLTMDEYGRNINGSSGSVTGGGAVILLYPEESLVVAYAINLTFDNDIEPVFKIASYFLD